MPLLYDIPAGVAHLVNSGQASVFGAIIKDGATGRIIAHMQPSSALSQVIGTLPGMATSAFNPLSAINLVQNEQIKRGLSELQHGMLLTQNLQYGTLALSGLGIGLSVAGFAAVLSRLRAIERQIDRLADAMARVTSDRREDDIKQIFAVISADLEQIDTLPGRRNPQALAEALQLSLMRGAYRLEAHFAREADLSTRTALPLAQIDLLFSLAAAIRISQEAAVFALFSVDELNAAEQLAATAAKRHLALAESISPDHLARLVGRGEDDPLAAQSLRLSALTPAGLLSDGLIGGVRTLAGQSALAHGLVEDGLSGPGYLSETRGARAGLLCLLRDPSQVAKT